MMNRGQKDLKIFHNSLKMKKEDLLAFPLDTEEFIELCKLPFD